MLGRTIMLRSLWVLAAVGIGLGGSPATPAAAACVGDCDGSGDVTVDELVTMVNIALGSAPLVGLYRRRCRQQRRSHHRRNHRGGEQRPDQLPGADGDGDAGSRHPRPRVTSVTHTVVVGPNGETHVQPAELDDPCGRYGAVDLVEQRPQRRQRQQTARPTTSSVHRATAAAPTAPLSARRERRTVTRSLRRARIPYFCSQHCGLGMAGTITVEPPAFAPAPLIKYVDPFIGSGGVGFGFGSAVPGAVAPFGMVRLWPGHHQGLVSRSIFTITVAITTMTEPSSAFPICISTAPERRATAIFGHAGAGIYAQQDHARRLPLQIFQEHGGRVTRLLLGTPEQRQHSGRADQHRPRRRAPLHLPNAAGASGAAVVIDAGHMIDTPATNIELTIDPDGRTVVGHHRADGGLSGGFDLYWVIAFDRPLKGYGGWSGQDVLANATSITSPSGGGGAYLEFDVPDGGVVNLRVGLSMVDLDGAKNNLAAEAPDFDFDAIRARTEARWESMLGRVKVVDSDPKHSAYVLYRRLPRADHADDLQRRRRPLSRLRPSDPPGRRFPILFRPVAVGHLPHAAPLVDPGLSRGAAGYHHLALEDVRARRLPADLAGVAAGHGNDDRRQRRAGDRRFLRQGAQGLRHGGGVHGGHALRPRAEPARLDLPGTPPHRGLSGARVRTDGGRRLRGLDDPRIRRLGRRVEPIRQSVRAAMPTPPSSPVAPELPQRLGPRNEILPHQTSRRLLQDALQSESSGVSTIARPPRGSISGTCRTIRKA